MSSLSTNHSSKSVADELLLINEKLSELGRAVERIASVVCAPDSQAQSNKVFSVKYQNAEDCSTYLKSNKFKKQFDDILARHNEMSSLR